MPEKIHYNFFPEQIKFQGKAEKCLWLVRKGYLESSDFGMFPSKLLQFHLYFEGSSIAYETLKHLVSWHGISNLLWNPIKVEKMSSIFKF